MGRGWGVFLTRAKNIFFARKRGCTGEEVDGRGAKGGPSEIVNRGGWGPAFSGFRPGPPPAREMEKNWGLCLNPGSGGGFGFSGGTPKRNLTPVFPPGPPTKKGEGPRFLRPPATQRIFRRGPALRTWRMGRKDGGGGTRVGATRGGTGGPKSFGLRAGRRGRKRRGKRNPGGTKNPSSILCMGWFSFHPPTCFPGGAKTKNSSVVVRKKGKGTLEIEGGNNPRGGENWDNLAFPPGKKGGLFWANFEDF